MPFAVPRGEPIEEPARQADPARAAEVERLAKEQRNAAELQAQKDAMENEGGNQQQGMGVKPAEAVQNTTPKRVTQNIYIVGLDGQDIAQADVWEVTPDGKRTFIEQKDGTQLGKINPITGKPFVDPVKELRSFVEKQIYNAGVKKAKGLLEGVSTRGDNGEVVPSIDEIRKARTIRFEIKADTPELRAEVEKRLQDLRRQFPTVTFEVRYGVIPSGN
jgi:hypothetical protein